MNKQQLQYVVLSILLIILVGSVIVLSNQRASPPRPELEQTTTIPIVVTEPTSVSIKDTPMVGSLRLSVAQPSMRVGQTQTVQVALQATGKVLDGADAVIRFDPSHVTVAAVTNGDYFTQLIRSTINQNEGTIKVSGFSPMRSSPLEGPVIFFTFTATAKQAGDTSFDLAYGENRSDLSTLVERGTSKNILTFVSNVDVTIQQ